MLILYFLTLPCIAFAVPSFVPVPGLGWVRAPGAGVAPAQGFVSPAAVHWPGYGWDSVNNAQHKLQGWCCGSDPPAGQEHCSVWRGSVELSSKVWWWLFFCSAREQQSVCKEVQTLSCHGSHGSFLISFYFWDPKVLAVLGWVVHPDLSALFCKSSDIQDVPGTSLPWVMLSLGAARQQLGWQMSISVPGDPHYTGCSAITALGHCAGSPRRWKSVLQPAPCCDHPVRRGMKSCRNHLFHLNHLLPLHLVWCKLHARIISCRSLLMDDLFIGWSIFGIFFDWWDRLVSEGIFWSF